MAKGVGIIGNVSGKVGNVVGYSLKDSNNKQTQGFRAYQPVVRNPKTAAQAEQRARMAPINEFYRRFKAIIDRGQEGVAYGNKSRLRWLSDALTQFDGPWLTKGDATFLPLKSPLTKGSLAEISINNINQPDVITNLFLPETAVITTVASLATALLAENTFLKDGDQLTFVLHGSKTVFFQSIILDTADTSAVLNFRNESGLLVWDVSAFAAVNVLAAAVILSREGDDGEHLRSTTSLTLSTATAANAAYTEAGKEAAIESYMAAGANTDWPQEKEA